jgi:hypothetical protein
LAHPSFVLGWATFYIVKTKSGRLSSKVRQTKNLERRHPEPGFSRVEDLALGGRYYANSALLQRESSTNQSLDCDRCHYIA